MATELFPPIVTLMRWGDAHLAGSEGPPIVLRHDDCGEITDSYLACRACGGEIDARNVTPERGAGYLEPAAEPRR